MNECWVPVRGEAGLNVHFWVTFEGADNGETPLCLQSQASIDARHHRALTTA